MSTFTFDDRARWIWSDRADRSANNFVAFRRVIDVAGDPAEAALHLTADSRYELHVNGEWLGHGPPRSWLTPWPVDMYDLRGVLRTAATSFKLTVATGAATRGRSRRGATPLTSESRHLRLRIGG